MKKLFILSVFAITIFNFSAVHTLTIFNHSQASIVILSTYGRIELPAGTPSRKRQLEEFSTKTTPSNLQTVDVRLNHEFLESLMFKIKGKTYFLLDRPLPDEMPELDNPLLKLSIFDEYVVFRFIEIDERVNELSINLAEPRDGSDSCMEE